MPSMETRHRYQKAVLRRFIKYDRYTNAVVGDPEEIRVRWQETNEEVIGPKGEPIALAAWVVVAEDLPIDSTMWLGSLEDWEDDTVDHSMLMVIKVRKKTPDVKNRHIRRTVGVTRLTDVQPAEV